MSKIFDQYADPRISDGMCIENSFFSQFGRSFSLFAAYQPPASSTFLSEQTSHQQPDSSTLLSKQTSTSHQPTEQADYMVTLLCHKDFQIPWLSMTPCAVRLCHETCYKPL
jgi:hypothetical protein